MKNKSNIVDVFPMSEIQQGMVFHSLKDKTGSVYHVQNIYIKNFKDFKLKLFQKAVALMVEKH